MKKNKYDKRKKVNFFYKNLIQAISKQKYDDDEKKEICTNLECPEKIRLQQLSKRLINERNLLYYTLLKIEAELNYMKFLYELNEDLAIVQEIIDWIPFAKKTETIIKKLLPILEDLINKLIKDNIKNEEKK